MTVSGWYFSIYLKDAFKSRDRFSNPAAFSIRPLDGCAVSTYQLTCKSWTAPSLKKISAVGVQGSSLSCAVQALLASMVLHRMGFSYFHLVGWTGQNHREHRQELLSEVDGYLNYPDESNESSKTIFLLNLKVHLAGKQQSHLKLSCNWINSVRIIKWKKYLACSSLDLLCRYKHSAWLHSRPMINGRQILKI